RCFSSAFVPSCWRFKRSFMNGDSVRRRSFGKLLRTVLLLTSALALGGFLGCGLINGRDGNVFWIGAPSHWFEWDKAGFRVIWLSWAFAELALSWVCFYAFQQ